MVTANDIRKMQSDSIANELVEIKNNLASLLLAAERTITEAASGGDRLKSVLVGHFNVDLFPQRPQVPAVNESTLPKPLKDFFDALKSRGFEVEANLQAPTYSYVCFSVSWH